MLPLELFASEGHKPDDLYIFAFLSGKVAASQEDVKRTIAAGQAIHLIHPLPKA
jgi:hypothetical protein